MGYYRDGYETYAEGRRALGRLVQRLRQGKGSMENTTTHQDTPPANLRADQLVDSLAGLLASYPTDPPWAEPALTLTVTVPGTDRRRDLDVPEGAAGLLLDVIDAQRRTAEGTRIDGAAACAHCEGRGEQRNSWVRPLD
ncbi:hypothetical protein SAMN05428942_7264 [Streptomyces sp. 2112.2]|uniref:hypothetical protein n=1 Tax=Streptomyces sp. 2112.2 TaxID=1881024 RepID=UPI000899621A|nr:hypothetical protein [Streptomyces sp. 2112.2]SEF16401.1 hypothetical protein SAMN05428942_7264 [Streptomyces sp. 2112.2]